MAKQHPSFWSTPTGWAAIGLIAAVSYFLLVEHSHHLFGWLPYLIFLLCPLMHFFMHGSHGKGHSKDHDDTEHNTAKNVHDSFQEKSQQADSYRQGYVDGLHQAREEKQQKDGRDER